MKAGENLGIKKIRRNKSSNVNTNLRFNLVTVITYLVGIILLVQLFDLQIVHGAEYREESNTRLTRESTLEATRGNIMDKSGNVLVSSTTKFGLELYKTKIDTENLNEAILNMIQVLEKYQVSYPDSFPININPYSFTLEGDNLVAWKKSNNMSDDITAEQAFFKMKDKYKISSADIGEARKIMAIRYEITQKGYSSTKAVTISNDIPREAVA